MERLRVVLTERLDVPDLESLLLHGPDHLGHVEQLAVGEHVAADERSRSQLGATRRRDGVVQQSPGGHEQRAEGLEVAGSSGMCRRARTCRSTRWRRTAPPAGPGSPAAGSRPARRARPRHPPGGLVHLLAAEGHADDPGLVVAGGVDGHRPPPASNVEEPGPGRLVEAELPADQLVLGRLGILEGGPGSHEPGARVGHARPQHQTVEGIAHVVVVADHLGVPALRVQPARGQALLGWGG